MPDRSSDSSIDSILDLLETPIMSWQRRMIHNILVADTPDDVACFAPPRQQLRLGLDYRSLMEHYSVEVIRRDIT